MLVFIKKYIASIVLLLSIVISTIDVDMLGKPLSNYINLQLILIYVFKISNPSLNFGRGFFLFLISIINDVLNGLLFGTTGLLYFIVFAVAAFQSSIKLRSIFISEWMSFAASLIFAYLVFFGLEILHNHHLLFSQVSINLVLTLVAYPVLWLLLTKIFIKDVIR